MYGGAACESGSAFVVKAEQNLFASCGSALARRSFCVFPWNPFEEINWKRWKVNPPEENPFCKGVKSKFVEENSFYTVVKSKFVEENPFCRGVKSKFLKENSFCTVVKSKFLEENPFYTVVKPNSEEGILKNGFYTVSLRGKSSLLPVGRFPSRKLP